MSDAKKGTNKQNNQPEQESRRRFLKNSGLVAGGIVGGSLLGTFIDNPFKNDNKGQTNDKPVREYTESRMFFTRYDDFDVLKSAVERIYPEDDNGPGALMLGVPYFIDKQLAGPYGSNKFDYMKGPAQDVKVASSYQTLMTRGEVIIEGLRKLNSESLAKHDTKFTEIEGEQQDELLAAMEAGEVELLGVKSNTFFNLLRQLTIEGVYADPLYGGNKDMMGWKMKEHPGIRAGYSDLIEEEEFQVIQQLSLKDYQR